MAHVVCIGHRHEFTDLLGAGFGEWVVCVYRACYIEVSGSCILVLDLWARLFVRCVTVDAFLTRLL